MKRSKVRPRKDRRVFSRTADKAHPKNYAQAPMRGGWRI